MELKNASTSLSPVLVVFLSMIGIGGVLAMVGDTGFSVFFVVLGLFFGGVAWIANTVFSWRSLLGRDRSERDPALEILREIRSWSDQ